MSKAFEILSGALEEAIADTRVNELPRRTRKITIEPLVSLFFSRNLKRSARTWAIHRRCLLSFSAYL